MYDNPELVADIQAAVDVGPEDLIIGREAALGALSSGTPLRVTDLEDAWLAHKGVERPGRQDQRVPLLRDRDAPHVLRPASTTDPLLLLHKAQRVVAQVVAELLAEGVVTPGRGDGYGVADERINVSHDGGSGSVAVSNRAPLLAHGRYQLTRPDVPYEELVVPDQLTEGLEHLLGPRGLAALVESRRALSRGLFLASSSLLAAASEAAWFNLGRAVPNPASKLKGSLKSGRDVAQVIEGVTSWSRERMKAPSITITELAADAHRFRDIRNYALHPVEDHDHDREAWLTAAGATVLTLTARRYLSKMAQLLDAIEDEDEAPDPPG